MSLAKRSALAVIALAGLAAVVFAAQRAAMDARTAVAPLTRDALVHHSLVYYDAQGKEQIYYFGRFDNFDWYFPCEFATGSWALGAGNVIRLSYDDPRFAARELRLAGAARTLTVADAGGAPTRAEITKENRLPFG